MGNNGNTGNELTRWTPDTDPIGKDPWKDWIRHAVVLAIVVALVGQLVIASTRLQDPTHLCVLMLTVFVLAVAKNVRDIFYVSTESRLAETQTAQIEIALGFGEGGFDRFFEETAKKPSLLRTHILMLYTIARKTPSLSQDNLIAIMQAKVRARLRLVEFASSFLVTIGLVGTIVGLIQSTSGLQGLMTPGADLAKGMSHTVAGMATAFNTTLLGALLGGIALRVLSHVVENHADFLVAHIAELTETHVLPALQEQARKRKARAVRLAREETIASGQVK